MSDKPAATRASTEVIRNCRFAFRCTQQWDTLSAGAHPRQRYCGECERHVVLCETDNELRAALARFSNRTPKSLATFIVSLDSIETVVLPASARQAFELLVLLVERWRCGRAVRRLSRYRSDRFGPRCRPCRCYRYRSC